MTNKPALTCFPSRALLAEGLAHEVAALLQRALKANGKALLVVSGGSTPVPFFEALRKEALDWPNVNIMLADERWVDASHADSNEKLVREHLLQEEAASARLISLAPKEAEPLNEGAGRLTAELNALAQTPDVSILGMGEDGHTASLFPDHASLEEGMQTDAPCLAVTGSPKPPSERVSLSAAMLCASAHLIVHITGNVKRAVLEEANPAHPITQLLTKSKTSPDVYWAE